MKYSIDDRLARLKDRRLDMENVQLRQRGFVEPFENRSQNKATKYALGSMEEVNQRSTEISIEEAEKVKKALVERLEKYGLKPTFRLQGSVPMNLHIRGVSDVDLLELHGQFLMYSTLGPASGNYAPMSAGKTIVGEILSMRSWSETELAQHFWGAKVDTGNAKSIQLSEGGFRRKVDVVPSSWYDSADYQKYGNEIFRGVTIVDKFTKQAADNFPFLFRHHINEKDGLTNGGAKMAIRLLKNIKSDSDSDCELSSYDIASIMFHCPRELIIRQVARDLSILSGTQIWLQRLCEDYAGTMILRTPDDTRFIFDKTEKWGALQQLSQDVTELAREVSAELVGPYYLGDRSLEDVRKHLFHSEIPLAPTF